MTATTEQPVEVDVAATSAAATRKIGLFGRLIRNQTVAIGAVIVAIIVLISLAAPFSGRPIRPRSAPQPAM